MTDEEIQNLFKSLGINSLLDEPKGKSKKQENMDLPRKELPPNINYGDDPSLREIRTPMYMGAPMTGNPISIMGGGGNFEGQGTKGIGYGGRLGAELQLSPEQRLLFGLSGGGTNLKYGMGQPYAGSVNRSDITGIDAMLIDMANNRQFGAELKKGMRGDPFLSLLFRQMF
ncbi:MAG: hypothetical protein EBU08_13785 [Micrococcales bacterium]|nr:hypothetical protein [Micrococcales bacterium]